jgi:DNA invertase Pin-like site-specific DNA recombinase
MQVFAYVRCSTNKQDEQSQAQQIIAHEGEEKSAGLAWTYDQASGSVPWQQRRLADVLAGARKGDWIVVSEVSRIARSTVGVLTFLQAAAQRGVNVYAVRSKLALDDSLHSKITVTVLALAAEIERDLLRERTRAALDARRAAGVKLGRPVGSRSPSILESRSAEIQRCLDARLSKRAIARLMDVAPGTLYAYLAGRDAALKRTSES